MMTPLTTTAECPALLDRSSASVERARSGGREGAGFDQSRVTGMSWGPAKVTSG